MGSLFGGGSKAPDPMATAQAQNQVNLEALRAATNLNQINERTPFGTRTYTGSYDTGDRQVTDELSPELMNILNSQLATTGSLSSIAQGRTAGIPREDFSLEGMPGIRQAQGLTFAQSRGTPQAFTNYEFGDFGPAQRDINDVGSQQRNVDLSGVQQIAGLGDFGGERQRVEDALFQRGSRRVNEQFGRDEQALQSRLAAQGITQGSEAYDREMSRLMQNRDDALATATEGSIINAGDEQGRLFGQSLAARQQGVGEQFSLADLFNQAQNVDYGQQADRARFYNEGQGQDFSQNFATVQSDRDRDIQRVGMDREWQAGDAAFAQDARQRQFDSGLSLQDADMQNRQNSINENVLSRNQNLNELIAMFSGSPISPQGQLSFQPRAQYNAAQGSPDLVGTANNNYSASQQAGASGLGSLFGSLGSLGASAITRYCWVAREVFGENDWRWLSFRDWMLHKAPAWFRNLYIKHGERFAEWVSDKPLLKRMIKAFMVTKVPA